MSKKMSKEAIDFLERHAREANRRALATEAELNRKLERRVKTLEDELSLAKAREYQEIRDYLEVGEKVFGLTMFLDIVDELYGDEIFEGRQG